MTGNGNGNGNDNGARAQARARARANRLRQLLPSVQDTTDDPGIGEILRLEPRAVEVSFDVVLDAMGVAPGAPQSDRVRASWQRARDLFHAHAKPVGRFAALSVTEMARVYQGEPGEDRNAVDTPIADVYPRAAALALFAGTLGEPVCRQIRTLSETHALAAACMLDALCSRATESLALALERRFLVHLAERGVARPGWSALRYSPGYCGWDITGQGALFAHLNPGAIGITLTPSSMMSPLKSVSGVLTAGPDGVHDQAAAYPACSDCENSDCESRIASRSTLTPTTQPTSPQSGRGARVDPQQES